MEILVHILHYFDNADFDSKSRMELLDQLINNCDCYGNSNYLNKHKNSVLHKYGA